MSKKALHLVSVCFCLGAATLPAYGSLIIPQVEWGSGQGDIRNTVYNYHGSSGCDLNASVSTCTSNIASNLAPNFQNSPNGTSSGTVTASTDMFGAHLYSTAGASGYGSTSVTGSAGFYDTVYNPTGNAAEFQLSFHLDATLFTRSSAVDTLQLSFSNQTLFQTQLNYGGAGTYNYVDQIFTTTVQTVAANSYTNWYVVLSTSLGVSSDANTQYLAGYPAAMVDAGNTLSLTGITIMDSQGNPLSNSGLTSYAGFDYSTSSTSASPEPGTIALMAGAGILLLFVKPRVAAV